MCMRAVYESNPVHLGGRGAHLKGRVRWKLVRSWELIYLPNNPRLLDRIKHYPVGVWLEAKWGRCPERLSETPSFHRPGHSGFHTLTLKDAKRYNRQRIKQSLTPLMFAQVRVIYRLDRGKGCGYDWSEHIPVETYQWMMYTGVVLNADGKEQKIRKAPSREGCN